MELKRYLSTILKWWWLIALSTAVAAAFSYYASAQSPRIYQTATTLMVGQALQSPNPDNIQVYAATQLAPLGVERIVFEPKNHPDRPQLIPPRNEACQYYVQESSLSKGKIKAI